MPKSRRLPTEEQLAKERKALELRRAKVTYDVIAKECGFANRSGAYKAVQSALSRTLQEPADELRAAEVDMLDKLHSSVWTRALRGDDRAVLNVLRTSAQRSKLLGLYAPVKTELTVSLDDRQAALIVGLLQAILTDLHLTPAQQTLAGEVVPRHLHALEAAEPARAG